MDKRRDADSRRPAIDPATAELIARYLDDRATQVEKQRLERLLKDSHRARRYFNEVCWIMRTVSENVAPELNRRAGDRVGGEPLIPASGSNASQGIDAVDWAGSALTRPVPFSIGVAAFTIVAALAALMAIYLPNRPADEGNQPPGNSRAVASAPRHVGRIVEAVDCRWGMKGNVNEQSESLVEGSLVDLAAGRLKVQFDSGAVVELVGPSTLRFESSMEGRLLAGRLMADVPRRAKGFVVSTAVAKIEDLGTRFGVEVDEAAGSLVHVYLGRVDVHGGMENGRWIRQLAAGQSLRIGPALDASEATSADRDSFAELFEVYEPIVATFAEGLPRLASDGWAGGWNTLFDADAVSLGGPSIEIKSPLSPTGAEYLACSLLGEKELSSSNRSAGFGFVFRRYGPQGRIDLSLPHEISFRYRLETPLSDGANRLRTAMLYDDSQLEEGVASATNTWAIRAYSESVDGVPAGHWTFVGGSESRGRLKRVDSTMPLVAGKVYAIRLRIWPKQREWDASISDGERTVGSATAAGEQMRFRTNSTRAGGVLHFGGRIKNPGERLEFSIDDLRIQRISWTERLSTQ